MEADRRFSPFPEGGPRGIPPKGRDWHGLMRMALELTNAPEYRSEVPVGALVVAPDGVICGASGNRVKADHDPAGHAEILAIRAACRAIGNERLQGHILVATLEPCLMCAAAILEARLAGVVFGCADRQAGAIASRADFIAITGESRHIWHIGGILAPECARKLRDFFIERR